MEIVTALERPAEEQRRTFNRAFADYVAGGRTLDTPGFGDILVSHGVSLPESHLAVAGGQVAGFAYMCTFARVSRLAIMGVVPDQRRQGIARALLEHAVAAARRQGQEILTLEVIEANEPAVGLYREAGMRPRRRLLGYSLLRDGPVRPVPPSPAPRRPRPVSLEEAVGHLIAGDTLRLPYQISGHALARAPQGCTAYRLGTAWVVVKSDDAGRTLLKAMLDTRPERDDLRNLLTSLMEAGGSREWRIAQILPEELGQTVLEPLGYRRLPLTQLQMELPL